MRRTALLLMLTLASASTLAAQSAADDKAAQFLAALQRAAAGTDRAALAALVRFPIVVDVGSGIRVPIADATALAQQHDAVFTPAWRQTIARASIKPGGVKVTAGANQLVIGNNVVVANAVGDAFKIVSIAVPPPAAGNRAAGAPQRISLRAGPDPTLRAGALAGNATDAYLVRAAKGQLVEVRITGVQGRDIVARILDAAGNPVDARAGQGVRAWSGRVAADGDYRIDVSRTGAGSDALPYTLSVKIR